MKFENMYKAAKDKVTHIDANDVLKVVGLQLLRSSPAIIGRIPVIALFGGGVALGAGVALLFAPKSGAETREAIGTWFKGAYETVKGATTKALSKTEAATSEVTEAIEDGLNVAKKKIGMKAKNFGHEAEALSDSHAR